MDIQIRPKNKVLVDSFLDRHFTLPDYVFTLSSFGGYEVLYGTSDMVEKVPVAAMTYFYNFDQKKILSIETLSFYIYQVPPFLNQKEVLKNLLYSIFEVLGDFEYLNPYLGEVIKISSKDSIDKAIAPLITSVNSAEKFFSEESEAVTSNASYKRYIKRTSKYPNAFKVYYSTKELLQIAEAEIDQKEVSSKLLDYSYSAIEKTDSDYRDHLLVLLLYGNLYPASYLLETQPDEFLLGKHFEMISNINNPFSEVSQFIYLQFFSACLHTNVKGAEKKMKKIIERIESKGIFSPEILYMYSWYKKGSAKENYDKYKKAFKKVRHQRSLYKRLSDDRFFLKDYLELFKKDARKKLTFTEKMSRF